MHAIKPKTAYLGYIVFAAAAVFLIIKAKDTRILLLGICILLFFGVGGTVCYVLDRKGKRRIGRQQTITIRQSRSRLLALLLGCLAFTAACYLFLPFNHVFDNSVHYTPVLGYIVGIAGILLFGCVGIVGSIIRLINPETMMQIMDEYMIVRQDKKMELIYWHEISSISRDGNFLSISLSSPDPDPEMAGRVRIPVSLIGHDVDEIRELIEKRAFK